MRRFFAFLSIVLYTGGVFLAGMLVANLYALYVLIYTGAVFMIGVYIGEKLEERFSVEAVSLQQAESEQKDSGQKDSGMTGVPDSEGVGVKQA